MSELSLIAAPSPELLAQAAAVTTSPANVAPGSAGPAAEDSGNPFADFLSGVLAGAQPLPPVADPLPFGGLPALAADDPPETDADAQAVLALPGNAAPLPALPGEFASPEVAGKSLPVAGNPLPGDPSPRADPVTDLQGPLRDPEAAGPTPAPGETRPRISLTDLALSRELEPAAEGERLEEPTSPALAFARKYLTPPLQTQSVAPTPASGSSVPATSTEFTAGMLAVLTAGNASNNGLREPAPLAVTGAPGIGTPPALQPLGDAGAFAGGLADRLLTLGGPGVQTARLQLHPEHLGALTVEIQIDDGTAQVWFGTTTSQAHSAIEGSLPRLRELFAEQGITLTRTQVDVGAGQMGNAGSGQQRRMAGGARPDVDRPWRAATPVRSLAIPGLLRNVSAQSQRLDVWA